MRQLRKFIVFIFILPATLLFDLILYAATKNCPGCGSFWQWVQTEGALSFPLVVELMEWLEGIMPQRRNNTPVKAVKKSHHG